MPSTGPAADSSASDTPKNGNPAAKLVVPSNGSRHHSPSAARGMISSWAGADISSPRNAYCGQCRASSACSRSCIAWSASVTTLPSSLMRRLTPPQLAERVLAAIASKRGSSSRRAALRTISR